MQTHTPSTPFGRRRMSLGLIAAQAAAREIEQDAIVDKRQVFRDIREAKEKLGASDRALAILYALLICHRADELSADQNLVVYPSNEVLILRTNGMSPATLRRHIANLVEIGLIIRRDSPNGKRFARKGEDGAIERAYGFDLSPILARAEEFKELAIAAQAERKTLRLLRERLTICRRDVVKMIAAGLSEDVPGNWQAFQRRYETIIARLPRTASRELLETIVGQLEDLWADVHQTLDLFVNSQNMNANESHSDRHIQDSNPNIIPNGESKYGSGNIEEASSSAERTDNVRALPRRDLPLGMVLSACPEIAKHALGGPIRTWRDLLAAAEEARPYLGISPSAWQEAVEVMGSQGAAVTVAGILQRSGQIRSGGGYLRSLTERSRNGQFSTWPMVMALLNEKLTTMENAAAGKRPEDDRRGGLRKRGEDEPRSIEISSALEKTMKGRGWT